MSEIAILWCCEIRANTRDASCGIPSTGHWSILTGCDSICLTASTPQSAGSSSPETSTIRTISAISYLSIAWTSRWNGSLAYSIKTSFTLIGQLHASIICSGFKVWTGCEIDTSVSVSVPLTFSRASTLFLKVDSCTRIDCALIVWPYTS